MDHIRIKKGFFYIILFRLIYLHVSVFGTPDKGSIDISDTFKLVLHVYFVKEMWKYRSDIRVSKFI